MYHHRQTASNFHPLTVQGATLSRDHCSDFLGLVIQAGAVASAIFIFHSFFSTSFTIVPYGATERPQTTATGTCKCAVFPVVEMSKSIIERSLQMDVTCDNEGEAKCLAMCVALAESAKDKAPQIICEKLSTHVENMRVAVYAKVCDNDAWKYTGVKSEGPLCCHDKKSVPCRDPSPMIAAP
ncbi:uncharacterized protein LOC143218363 [Lasioglossum baleicum]|uniref:uncharacterized protein LOC143218363 n=1 Tax=Lasioglossum baleicum TaxID=434251 RepID=UPI003FCC3F2F